MFHFAAEPTDPNVPSLELQPLRAFAALKKLIANPDDTSQVFTMIEALSGKAPLRVLRRFRADPDGKRLLETRADIRPILVDRAKLERMPRGSLAEAYLAFLDREGITADGLVEASKQGETGAFGTGNDLAYLGDRMRDTHDLWHALSGYQGDVVGETALLAFSIAQTKNPAVALIVLTALVRAHDVELTKLVVNAFRDGQRAAWLPAVVWEELLPLPLAEVRKRLRVSHAPPYVPTRTSEMRAMGELAPA
jgi:ubiquinone biosynthesis protein COQ4